MEKIEKKTMIENQISKPWMQLICFVFLDLIYSIHKPERKPNALNHWSCAETTIKLEKFVKETEFWKLTCRVIQASKPIPLASSRIIGHIPIKNIHQDSRNRYTELEIFHEKCIIVFPYLDIFLAFFWYIHTNWLVLKLTMCFDWSFMHYTRFRHERILGFCKLQIRGFVTRKN